MNFLPVQPKGITDRRMGSHHCKRCWFIGISLVEMLSNCGDLQCSIFKDIFVIFNQKIIFFKVTYLTELKFGILVLWDDLVERLANFGAICTVVFLRLFL